MDFGISIVIECVSKKDLVVLGLHFQNISLVRQCLCIFLFGYFVIFDDVTSVIIFKNFNFRFYHQTDIIDRDQYRVSATTFVTSSASLICPYLSCKLCYDPTFFIDLIFVRSAVFLDNICQVSSQCSYVQRQLINLPDRFIQYSFFIRRDFP